ncbi:MAG: hypothetical protein P4L93_06495 [Coriobacteriia bacterium]|nr:hypothetical protein [Coriobacteriia bacterium]
MTIVRSLVVVPLIVACALAGVGVGCTPARPTQGTAPSAATRPTLSRETTQSIKAQIQLRIAQREVVAGEIKALEAQIAAGSESSDTPAGGAKIEAMLAQRGVLAAQVDTLDTVIEAEVERYDALQPSAPIAKP